MSRIVKDCTPRVGVLENIYFLNRSLTKHVRISFVADFDFSLRIQFLDRVSSICLDFHEYCSLCVHRTGIWENLTKSTYFCTNLNDRLQLLVKNQCIVLKDTSTGVKTLFSSKEWHTVEKLFPCLNRSVHNYYNRESKVRDYVQTLLKHKDFEAPQKDLDCIPIEEAERIYNELFFIDKINLYLLNYDQSTNSAITYGPPSLEYEVGNN